MSEPTTEHNGCTLVPDVNNRWYCAVCCRRYTTLWTELAIRARTVQATARASTAVGADGDD